MSGGPKTPGEEFRESADEVEGAVQSNMPDPNAPAQEFDPTKPFGDPDAAGNGDGGGGGDGGGE